MVLHHKRLVGRYCYIVIIFCFIIFYLLIFKSLPDSLQTNDRTNERQKKQLTKFTGPVTKENLAERLTVIIREFEDFDNALSKTVDAIEKALGNVPVYIVADHLPYPPVKLEPESSARLVTLSSDLTKNYSTSCVSELVKTQYVLIIPDAVKLKDVKQIQTFIGFLKSKRHTKAIAIPVTSNQLQCHDLDVDLKSWSVSLRVNYTANTFYCPLVKGSHGLLMESETFKSLAEPFARPFPFTFYIQSKLKNWWTRIMKSGRLDVLTDLYKESHSAWKHKTAEADRLHAFYHTVGIKQEKSSTGFSKYFGCDKNTPRCFGTVINDMPDYLYQGRWTPPCCLKALRETSAHVFSVLEKCKVRYWLEGGSLLGAVRHKDIIPWDYDVDLGIYIDDIEKCLPLTKASEGQYIDGEDFVWEKAKEGEFFRVQYSEVNHLHVDIYPFYSKDGIMTKDTWFLTHRQDTEFPEKFVTTLVKIEFAGVIASAPKNAREFLEFKFGEGVIEHPKYPNLQDPR